jgi:hypothetical protein
MAYFYKKLLLICQLSIGVLLSLQPFNQVCMSHRQHIVDLLNSKAVEHHRLALALLQGQRELMPVDFQEQLLDFYQWLWPHQPWGDPKDAATADKIVCSFLRFKSVKLKPTQQDLHPAIGLLFSLERLEIDHAQLRTLPESIGRLHYLVSLSLADNQLEDLPKNMVHLERLRILDLRYNRFTQLPAHLWAIPHLESIFLSHNPLQTLPNPAPDQLHRLQSLDIDHCQLQTLPPNLWQAPTLAFLNLKNNQLQTLPAVAGLPSFKHLVVDHNPNLVFPASNSFDTHYFSIDHHPCPDLPNCIRSMTMLEQLSIVGTRFSKLPLWLMDLPQLQKVFTKGRLLQDPVAQQLKTRGVEVY